MPGTNAAAFAESRDAFNASENAVDGLGPIFNERACGTCHQNGAIGGAGQQIEQRYGTLANGVFDPPRRDRAGSLRQLFGLGGYNVGGLNCQSGTDAESGAGRDHLRGPATTPLFGLGLVDSLPDSSFDTLAAPRAGGHPRHRQPGHHRVAEPARPGADHGRDARRPLRLEGRRAQPRAVLG